MSRRQFVQGSDVTPTGWTLGSEKHAWHLKNKSTRLVRCVKCGEYKVRGVSAQCAGRKPSMQVNQGF